MGQDPKRSPRRPPPTTAGAASDAKRDHIVIVGRPNVGKSTLFNRLLGRRQAIVFDQPGITRDCLSEACEGPTRSYMLVDTAGWDGDAADGWLQAACQAQLAVWVERAAVTIFLTDGVVGVTPADAQLAIWLRRCGRPVILACNKADHFRHDARADDFWSLGLGVPVPISAEHGRGIDGLWDRVEQVATGTLPQLQADADLQPANTPAADDSADAGLPVAVAGVPADALASEAPAQHPKHHRVAERVVLIGRPNAGKSSLANRLGGQLRLITAPEAGTTRDPVAVPGCGPDGAYTLVDTAGVARRREKTGLLGLIGRATFAALSQAQVAVVVCDGAQPPALGDVRLVAAAAEAGRAVVIAANKGDRVPRGEARAAWMASLSGQIPALFWVPRVWISAASGEGMAALFEQIARVAAAWQRRIGTGELNRTIGRLVRAHPPPAASGKRPRIFYASQPQVGPPTFVLSTRHDGAMTSAYSRYLQRGLRQTHDFTGAPLWVKFRPHRSTDAGVD